MGTRHSCGIEALRSALFLAPMCSQTGAGLSVAARPFAIEAKPDACFASAVIPMVCKLLWGETTEGWLVAERNKEGEKW